MNITIYFFLFFFTGKIVECFYAIMFNLFHKLFRQTDKLLLKYNSKDCIEIKEKKIPNLVICVRHAKIFILKKILPDT